MKYTKKFKEELTKRLKLNASQEDSLWEGEYIAMPYRRTTCVVPHPTKPRHLLVIELKAPVRPLKKHLEALKHLRKFIRLLRSGKYHQGNGRLVSVQKNGHKNYCVGGIACLAVPESVGKLHKQERPGADDKDVYGFTPVDGTFEDICIPEQVAEYLGMDDYATLASRLIVVDRYGERQGRMDTSVGLVMLNDEYNLSFSTMANLLEAWMNLMKGNNTNKIKFYN